MHSHAHTRDHNLGYPTLNKCEICHQPTFDDADPLAARIAHGQGWAHAGCATDEHRELERDARDEQMYDQSEPDEQMYEYDPLEAFDNDDASFADPD